MRYLGFIPARAGSKGIPDKNMALLNGKPLIWYTLRSAMESVLRESLFLSTDSERIAEYCRSEGLQVEYMRPSFLAADDTPMIEAVRDGLCFLHQKKGCSVENVILLQPTSPFRTAGEINRAIETYETRSLNSLVGVSPMSHHPYECIEVDGDGAWAYLRKSPANATRRQAYKGGFYFINGAIYIAKTEVLLRTSGFVVEGEAFPFVMDPLNAIDIDEQIDLKMAEAMMTAREKLE